VQRVQITPKYAALALLSLLFTTQIFAAPQLCGASRASKHPLRMLRLRPLIDWMLVVTALLIFALSFNLASVYANEVILSWVFATALALLAADVYASKLASWLTAASTSTARHIIIGVNDVGLELAKRVSQSAGFGKVLGFFDYRSPERLPDGTRQQLLGHCRDVAEYVRRNSIRTVYIALPISTAPRISALLQELRDTTASIYFVPNLFAFDLVQARCVDINGMPALAICDTPMQGLSGIGKRITDIVFATLALVMISPIFITIAAAVRLSSPGAVLFKQKRYGLNGEEILVYKFRSMTVCENGAVVMQATKNDRRVTPLGKFLRRSSLDELPQIINVLQGTMSFVGPRPHAVAHNEQYRKLISGYMIRHKVRPGITGWAQVNGLRGETDTIDKMQRRVQFDLDYLRNWSFWLDIKIISKTVLTVLKDSNAY
jgi:putative colanic acid biosynthesis UDP-glucose lipid carrier transferase